MDTSTLPQRLTDRKRAAIVDAAIENFSRRLRRDQHGSHRARADVSKRTVYNHFPGKETLFAAILQKLWDATRTGSSPTYRADVLREHCSHCWIARCACSAMRHFCRSHASRSVRPSIRRNVRVTWSSASANAR